MATSLSKHLIFRTILFVCACFLALQGGEVEGKSVSWSTGNVSDRLAYYGDCGGGCGTVTWVNGLTDFNVNILRQAHVYKNGSEVVDGASVAVGDTLSFVAPIYDTDISWNGTGRTVDTPYGHWLNGAVSPDSVDYVNDFISTIDSYSIYIPLSVNPSAITYTHTGSTAGLSCSGDGSSCIITSPGSVETQVNYSNTYGKFYYHYKQGGGYNNAYLYFNKVAMRKSGIEPAPPGASFLTGASFVSLLQYCVVNINCDGLIANSDYTLPIPSQTIPFTLTAVSNNNTPTAPTIIGPTSGTTNTAYSFTLTGTDPDSDTIRYGLDWNRDNLVDQWVPSTGYVPSGTGQSVNKLWPAVGTYTFQALTEDVKSGRSGWTTHTITITTPCTTQIINNCGVTATPSGGNSGTCTILGTCNYSCTNGVWTQNSNACIVPACSDGIDNSDLEDTFIDMADPGCTSIIDDDEYNLPENPVLTVNRRTVEKDDTVTLTWDTNNGNEALCTLTAYSGGPNRLTADGDPSTGTLNVTIPARSTYTLSCPNPLGGAPLTDTVSVDIVPVGAET